MSAFDIDFTGDGTGLPVIMTPVRLRGPKRLAWLECLLSAVAAPYADLMAFRANYLYVLGHGPQVCFLQGALNDVFDNVDRGIFISDGPRNFPVYIYRDDEEKPVWLATDGEVGSTAYAAPQWLFTDDEIYSSGVDFIVNVPSAVAGAGGYDVNYLKAIVNRYKLPNKSYSVNIF